MSGHLRCLRRKTGRKSQDLFFFSLPDLPLQSSELKDLHKARKIILPGCDFPQNFQNIGTDPLDFAGWPKQLFTWNLHKISKMWRRPSGKCVCPAGEMECEKHKKDNWEHVFLLGRYLSFISGAMRENSVHCFSVDFFPPKFKASEFIVQLFQSPFPHNTPAPLLSLYSSYFLPVFLVSKGISAPKLFFWCLSSPECGSVHPWG